jgi:hypothetical protein
MARSRWCPIATPPRSAATSVVPRGTKWVLLPNEGVLGRRSLGKCHRPADPTGRRVGGTEVVHFDVRGPPRRATFHASSGWERAPGRVELGAGPGAAGLSAASPRPSSRKEPAPQRANSGCPPTKRRHISWSAITVCWAADASSAPRSAPGPPCDFIPSGGCAGTGRARPWGWMFASRGAPRRLGQPGRSTSMSPFLWTPEVAAADARTHLPR